MFLANFPVEPVSWSSPPPAILHIDQSGSCTLFADNLATPSADTIWVDRLQIVPWYDHSISPGDRRRAVIDCFLSQWREQLPSCVALESRATPADVLLQLRNFAATTEIVAIDDELLQLRRRKAADELDLLRRCIQAGEAGHARSWDAVRPGRTEMDVYADIVHACTVAAGQPVVVYGDFCSGPRTWLKRGGPPTSRRLEQGDLIILDFSVVIGGYRGDFTNTIAVGGNPSVKQRQLAELCHAAMLAGERAIRDGTRCRDLFDTINSPLIQADAALSLTGHAGHGIGLAHPEPPIITPRSTDTLMAHDVITLEPGAYVLGLGGMRFENNYLVTKDGFERLTRHRIGLV
jgi:Xaa-Pro aminopeptidase